jgi:hypothetical protein
MEVLNLYDYPPIANAIAYEEMKEALEQAIGARDDN